jgi:hypothetical protein
MGIQPTGNGRLSWHLAGVANPARQMGRAARAAYESGFTAQRNLEQLLAINDRACEGGTTDIQRAGPA